MKKYHYLEYIIPKTQDNKEILLILQQNMGLSARKIRELKRHPEGILLNDKPVIVRETGRSGQALKVILNDTEEDSEKILPAPMELSILYEDEDLIFINKPPGVVCHPSKGHLTDSISNGVAAYFLEKKEPSRIHLIGRLDKDTSGILGIAKNKVTAERMITLRKEGKIQKEYLALVHRCPEKEEGIIEISMREYRNRESGDSRLKMKRAEAVSGKTEKEKSENGKIARSHYRILRKFSEHTLCQLMIETGRTHQIRFHMAEIGCPLVGDTLYGYDEEKKGEENTRLYNKTSGERAALHAYKLRFHHPFTNDEVILTAPIPEDMQKQMGFFEHFSPRFNILEI